MPRSTRGLAAQKSRQHVIIATPRATMSGASGSMAGALACRVGAPRHGTPEAVEPQSRIDGLSPARVLRFARRRVRQGGRSVVAHRSLAGDQGRRRTSAGCWSRNASETPRRCCQTIGHSLTLASCPHSKIKRRGIGTIRNWHVLRPRGMACRRSLFLGQSTSGTQNRIG